MALATPRSQHAQPRGQPRRRASAGLFEFLSSEVELPPSPDPMTVLSWWPAKVFRWLCSLRKLWRWLRSWRWWWRNLPWSFRPETRMLGSP